MSFNTFWPRLRACCDGQPYHVCHVNIILQPRFGAPQEGWKLDRATVERFLRHIEAEYLSNPYHNAIHAADVTQMSAVILNSLQKQLKGIPKLEMFSIILASAVHDLGHLGVNNDFLINSKHPRATTYNDKSVNENFHVSRAFELARTAPGCDLLAPLSADEQKQVCVHARHIALVRIITFAVIPGKRYHGKMSMEARAGLHGAVSLRAACESTMNWRMLRRYASL